MTYFYFEGYGRWYGYKETPPFYWEGYPDYYQKNFSYNWGIFRIDKTSEVKFLFSREHKLEISILRPCMENISLTPLPCDYQEYYENLNDGEELFSYDDFVNMAVNGDLYLSIDESRDYILEPRDINTQTAAQQIVEEFIQTQTSITKAHLQSKKIKRQTETQNMYANWHKAYETLASQHPNKSSVQIAKQIEKMDIAQGRNSETIRKNMGAKK